MSSGELAPRPRDYRPTRRAGTGSGERTAVRRMMDIRKEALIDRARIHAETDNAREQAARLMDGAYDLSEQVVLRSHGLKQLIAELGNDPVHVQIRAYVDGGAAEVITLFMQGDEQ